MLALDDAVGQILALAEPLESVEVTLTEAMGLSLADPLLADVDAPPFDRAECDGFAFRASDAVEPGARLRILNPRRGRTGRTRTAEMVVGCSETARVSAGDPMPIGADTVLPVEHVRPEAGFGEGETVVIGRSLRTGDGVIGRGLLLSAGEELARAGTRLRLPMVPLLAAQGWAHPVCRRRVRVAVLAVGDHLVGPAEAPVMHRERNASGPTIVAPCLQWGATAHDLGVVPERELPQALDRALTAPVVVVVASPDGRASRALKRARVESIFDGVAIEPGGESHYGVVRDASGKARHHVLVMPPDPIGVFIGLVFLLEPLIARLQGGPSERKSRLRAVWDGPAQAGLSERLEAIPSVLVQDAEARLRVRPVHYRGRDDLAGFARADALALLPPRDRNWEAGEIIELISLGDMMPQRLAS
jgi:molybdopterin biosynthesis enzyme